MTDAIATINAAYEAWQMTQQFERPDWAYAAVGALAVTAGADLFKGHREKKNQPKVDATPLANDEFPTRSPLANDEIRIQSKKNYNRRRRLDRTALALGASVLASVAFWAARPVVEGHDSVGSATVVINADFSGDAPDMGGMTRYDAAVQGALDAAGEVDVPVSFYAADSVSQPIGTTDPAHKKHDVPAVSRKFGSLVTRPKRNGYSLMTGVTDASNLSINGGNHIIVVGSELNSEDEQTLKGINDGMQLTHSGDVSAVVEGRGDSKYFAAGDQLTAGTDVEQYQSALGKDHVETAKTEAEVKKDVEKIIKSHVESKHIHRQHWPEGMIVGTAAAISFLGIYRRLSGTFRFKKLHEFGNSINNLLRIGKREV